MIYIRKSKTPNIIVEKATANIGSRPLVLNCKRKMNKI